MAQRRGAERAWQRLTYGAAAPQVDAATQWLLDLQRPGAVVMVLSGNSLEHAVFELAAMQARMPYVPVTPAYSLLSNDHEKLRAMVALIRPAVVLDLHGLTQQQAKTELAGLLAYCEQQHFNCACVVHGKGLGILAKRVPNWLVQHPNVRAFHTAPTHWGRDGALLVLLKTPDKTPDVR